MNIILGFRSEQLNHDVARMLEAGTEVVAVECHADPGMAVRSALRKGEGSLVLLALDELDAETIAASNMGGLQLLLLIESGDSVDLGRVTSVRTCGILEVEGVTQEALQDCLHRIRAGQVPMPGRLAQRMLTPDWAGAAAAPKPRLTPRETEVLALLVDGLGNKQIGRRLGISDHGAKRLVANILAKLDCLNRTQAVSRALQEGLYERCATAGVR